MFPSEKKVQICTFFWPTALPVPFGTGENFRSHFSACLGFSPCSPMGRAPGRAQAATWGVGRGTFQELAGKSSGRPQRQAVLSIDDLILFATCFALRFSIRRILKGGQDAGMGAEDTSVYRDCDVPGNQPEPRSLTWRWIAIPRTRLDECYATRYGRRLRPRLCLNLVVEIPCGSSEYRQ